MSVKGTNLKVTLYSNVTEETQEEQQEQREEKKGKRETARERKWKQRIKSQIFKLAHVFAQGVN